MNCLTDYIGLRGCGSSAPASGFYINDLPGISLKQMVSLTNEEEKTYLDLWSVIQTRAQSRFSLDVREAMGKLYRLKSLTNGINMPKQVQNVIKPAIAGSKAGFIIQMNEAQNYDYIASPLNAIHIQQLFFYGSVQEKGIFVVYDAYTNEALWSSGNYELTQDGWNTIEVNQTFNAQALAVYATPNVSDPISAYYTTEAPNYHQTPGCCDIRLNGFYTETTWDAFTNDALESQTTNTYGLTATFSIVCTWDNLICTNKSLFTRPWWYLCGIELLTEQLYSSKLNQFTTVNLQRAKELREEYQVEYMKALEQIAGGFNLACDCCIECSGGVQLRETTSFY